MASAREKPPVIPAALVLIEIFGDLLQRGVEALAEHDEIPTRMSSLDPGWAQWHCSIGIEADIHPWRLPARFRWGSFDPSHRGVIGAQIRDIESEWCFPLDSGRQDADIASPHQLSSGNSAIGMDCLIEPKA
jgi:hypothetical protein